MLTADIPVTTVESDAIGGDVSDQTWSKLSFPTFFSSAVNSFPVDGGGENNLQINK